ncbi:Hypothetical predicted protein [Olea europaea subsp. europaea]|uniref:Uncharacterized protein n=1 Tax=Olea europaea subsp. europaea TaxID=158383 RepID=A0A8S0RDM1_OLEEU|nr:Hypothetical predicted protein [Olea europaea subsp. europaea]
MAPMIPRHALCSQLLVTGVTICVTVACVRADQMSLIRREELSNLLRTHEFYLKRSLCNTFGGCSPAYSRSLPADRTDFKFAQGQQTRERASQSYVKEAPHELVDGRPISNLRLPPARVVEFIREEPHLEYHYIDRHQRVDARLAATMGK